MDSPKPSEAPRIGLSSTFANIARSHSLKLPELSTQIKTFHEKIRNVPSDDERLQLQADLWPIEEEYEHSALIAIVFCAMAVESFIYDYAARNLGDNYVQKHLDKLDVVSKWVVVTQLITGKRFPSDRRAYQMLKSLVQQRNNLVHHKSLYFDFDDLDHWKRVFDKEAEIGKVAEDAILTLDELTQTLGELDENEYFVNMILGKQGWLKYR